MADQQRLVRIDWDKDSYSIRSVTDRVNFENIIRYEYQWLVDDYGLKSTTDLYYHKINIWDFFYPRADQNTDLGPYIFIYGSHHHGEGVLRAEFINESNVYYSNCGKPHYDLRSKRDSDSTE